MEVNTMPSVRVEPTSLSYHFYLVGPIGEPENYIDLTHTLNTASPADVIYLHLNTPGGSLYTTLGIIQAIRDSDATVVACADGLVASAGAILFFACGAMKVGDYANFMIHDGSGMSQGKINENLISAQQDSKLFRKLYDDIFYPFLTKKEIANILKGQDLYMDSEDVDKRIERAIKIKERELNETS